MGSSKRDLIMEKTLELVEKKPLKKIGIRDISDACGITRSTFYYYFTDIYDVLNQIVQQELDVLADRYEHDFGEMAFELFQFVAKHKKAWINLYKTQGRDWLAKYVMTRLHILVKRSIRESAGENKITPQDMEIICVFYEEAIFGLLIRWLNDEKKIQTTEDLKQTIERISVLFAGQLDLVISNISRERE